MNKITIVFSHPYSGSFNHAILEKIEKILKEKEQDYNLIDLYKDKFNPVYSEEELKYYHEGKALDPLVEKYQNMLKDSNSLILIFPIWWGNIPAILKGFFEKVMLNNFSHINVKRGIKGKLQNIEHAVIITTSTSPTWYLKFFAGNYVKKGLANYLLKGIGISKTKWINMGQINNSSDEDRKEFLADLTEL